MNGTKIIGAAALSVAFAFAAPAFAQHVERGGHGAHVVGGARTGTAHVVARSGGARFAGSRVGGFRGERFGRGAGLGFAAGLAAGSALGYGGGYYGGGGGYYGGDQVYGYGDQPYDYGDQAYGYGDGYGQSFADSPDDESGYCAQRYRSFDPSSGTYLGYDGARHPCP